MADESYLTFAVKTNDNRYEQPKFYKFNSIKCVSYSRVCDLINDCRDWSDEENCTNHMIGKNTVNWGNRRQLIALSQSCDGIYDCFDLSDECNERCGKRILSNRFLRVLCWSMGIIALVFNFSTVVNEMKLFKECETNNMFTTRALVSLIGCGDFLIGVRESTW